MIIIIMRELILTDRALMMGLMLHTNARSLVRKQKFKEALDVLYMGEVNCTNCIFVLICQER